MRKATILVPTDFSDYSRAAVEIASSLARGIGARLMVLHVQEPVVPSIGEDTGVFDPDEMFLLRRLEQCVPIDANIEVEHRMEQGDPATEILRLADKLHVDMIIVGRHGRSGILHLLLGSVTQRVLEKATCPVLMIQAHVNRLDRELAW